MRIRKIVSPSTVEIILTLNKTSKQLDVSVHAVLLESFMTVIKFCERLKSFPHSATLSAYNGLQRHSGE